MEDHRDDDDEDDDDEGGDDVMRYLQKSLMAVGVKPRLLRPLMVRSRGSSHPYDGRRSEGR